MKLLKTGDPITVSSGWRRYQTKPMYANDNGQHQMLKYTPENNHCLAMFWGPLAPPHTRIAVVQSNKETFRIAAKAVILDYEHGANVTKEIKWKGTHVRVSKKTALVKFTPDIDIANFEGALIQTISGIDGRVDKAVDSAGVAKCTFKYRIGRNDEVFMRVLCQVEAPRFFNPLWTVDRTVPVDKDSVEKDDPDQRRLRRRGITFHEFPEMSHIGLHGTTIIGVPTMTRVFVSGDGFGMDIEDPNTERENAALGIEPTPAVRELNKVKLFGNNVLAASAGSSIWIFG